MLQRKPHFKNFLAVGTITALCVALAFAWQVPGPTQLSAQVATPSAPQSHAKELSKAFRAAAELVQPTVVTIETHVKPREVKRAPRGQGQGQGQRPQAENPFKGTPFEKFFDENNPGMHNFGDFHGSTPPREGMGSGVIIDKSGIILTNNHVVEGADEVVVRLHDGREFKSIDIKTDPDTDLAVVRIKADGSLPAAKLGNSDDMDTGDWVIAVGNPFGLDSTVSAGIISGKGRELRGGGKGQRTRFLQTDAAINPGNSGGPLVNLDGEVVGINTAIATNSGGYQGVGFAIPSNLAQWVSAQLIKSGTVQRAWLGVQIGLVSGDLAEKFGVERNGGVLVSEVRPGSPAAAAGLETGDIITEYAGTAVHNPRDLQEIVERTPVDTKQPVKVVRDGKTKTLEVLVKALPKDMAQLSPGRGESPSALSNEALGLSVTDMSADQAKQLGFDGYQGVLISEVVPDSVAAKAGLSDGMLILKVGKAPVHSVQEFEEAMSKQSIEKGVLLLVRTEAGNQFVVIKSE